MTRGSPGPQPLPPASPRGSGHLLGQGLRQVGQVVGDVLAEGVSQVGGQALNGLGAADQGLHGEADEGDLQGKEQQGQ